MGNGEKSFDATYPPFLLHPHGFGFLGKDVNYYVFQSIFDLNKFINEQHSGDEHYLSNLCEVAKTIGRVYFTKGQLPRNPEQLTNAIIGKVYPME
jgi:hypothetical protein